MAVTKQQYIEAVRHLAVEKMKLALRRISVSGQETDEPTIERQKQELAKEEMQFWNMSEQELKHGLFIPLEYLCQVWGCGDFQRHCLLLALGYELIPRIAADCAVICGSQTENYLTLWLTELSWHKEAETSELYEIFLATSPFMQLFRQPSQQPDSLMKKRLQLNPRICSFLLWDLEEGRGLSALLTRWEPGQRQYLLKRNQPDIAALLTEEIQIVELYGDQGRGRRFCAKAACTKLGRTAYLVNPVEFGGYKKLPQRLAEEILLECMLFQAIPVLLIPDDLDQEVLDSWIKKLVYPILERGELVFLISPKPLFRQRFGAAVKCLVLEIPDLNLLEKREVWRQESLPYAFTEEVHVEEMANLFNFTYGKIKEALSQADEYARSQGHKAIDRNSLRRGSYRFFEQNIIKKAVKIPIVYDWNDLVLPVLQKDLLLSACNQVKFKHKVYEEWGFEHKMPYGRGISMIFAGVPGTGKTMAAQVFAAELGIDLYKVELSAVVSKYVGETEKNLDQIFMQAQQSQIILFFDEADVLFSKRTEVKEANDKYNNMEAAFLLQKIEAYEGVTILATNLIQNFDEAFKRRVKFMIDFPFPDYHQRKLLWERSIPSQMPVAELDLDYLSAKFELSGSSIRNIVLHAAFLAASENNVIGMKEILMAVKNEFGKSGKILTREDMGEYHILFENIC